MLVKAKEASPFEVRRVSQFEASSDAWATKCVGEKYEKKRKRPSLMSQVLLRLISLNEFETDDEE